MTQDAPQARSRIRLHHEPETTAKALFERARRLDQVAGFGYEMGDFLTDLVPFLDALSRRVPASGGELEDMKYLLACVEAHADKFPVPDHMRKLVERVRASLLLAASPIVAAPEGWRLVPVEPTRQMIVAAEDELENQTDSDYDSDADGNRFPYSIRRPGWERAVYQAMLAAAPPVPEGKAESVAQPVKSTPSSARCEKPSGHCPNVKEVGGGFEGERYRCDVCGYSYFLDYEDMK